METTRCYSCKKFCRPYDSRTRFGCADPEDPEPYDPDYFCRKCSNKLYKELLKGYQCCKVDGDYIKSKAEVRAAKEAGLIWIDDLYINTLSGESVHNQYTHPYYMRYLMEYGEYKKKQIDENRCECWRKKNNEGKCERCNHEPLHCLCKYDNGIPF